MQEQVLISAMSIIRWPFCQSNAATSTSCKVQWRYEAPFHGILLSGGKAVVEMRKWSKP